MAPPNASRLTEFEVEAVARAIELGEVTPRTRRGPPYPKGWEVLSVYDEERARTWQLVQERARVEAALTEMKRKVGDGAYVRTLKRAESAEASLREAEDRTRHAHEKLQEMRADGDLSILAFYRVSELFCDIEGAYTTSTEAGNYDA